MTDRPILFSAPMIRALLAGTKTQTRRVITSARVFATPEQQAFTLRDGDLTRAMQGASRFRWLVGNGWSWEADAFEWQTPHTRTRWMAHIGFAPEDQLWVREAWKAHSTFEGMPPRDIPPSKVFYLADDGYSPSGSRGRPGMFMPRWASRLTLTVTDVRVERLQDISEADAIAEGATRVQYGTPPGGPERDAFHHRQKMDGWNGAFETARASYRHLWNAINRPGSWEANPWVAAYTFTVAQQNIDAEAA
ncbi:MAG TPA: hypothetical protein VGN75_09345 [Kaistia sp.]|jgi:hypothetical protein|nr:hypothetical protein [Kaistia sp.]